ncbi:MAG: DsbA family protein [Cyanobacteria bacterium P01_F01_bin.143]
MRMRRFRFIPFFIASLFIGWISLSGFASAAIANATLEEQVIQIILDHPEVLIESVQSYQKRKRQESKQKQQALLQEITTYPVSLIGNSPTTGAVGKKIVLLEFSDFQCPFCAQAESTLKEFMAQHQDLVTLVYKHFPLTQIHSYAQSAAEAAWAAQQQGKFWPYHDALFEQQKELGEDLYLAIAQSLNLDLEQFNRDRHSLAAKAAINSDIELAEQVGIRGTPFFALNGQVLSLPLQISAMEDLL